MRILQVVHGYPPYAEAGTERYTQQLTEGLRARGHHVSLLAARALPGVPEGTLLPPSARDASDPDLHWIVRNSPFGALRRGESDAAVDRAFRALVARLAPDVLHLQHPRYLSSTLPLPAPAVWTLHDAWGWCAASGQLLEHHADAPPTPCPGPSPARCAACAPHHGVESPGVERALHAAERLSALAPPPLLHRAWRRLPSRAQALLLQALSAPPTPLDAAILERRRDHFLDLARRCAQLLSPSRALADLAVAAGLPAPRVLPQGAPPPPARWRGGGDFLFLGTLAPHKGPDIVHRAWARARAAGCTRGLRIHGSPLANPGFAATIPHHGPLSRAQVLAALRDAQAVVMGSVWPENAPLVILEARAVGCPILAPAIGGIPEQVTHGVDGWLYPPGDEAALAACLLEADHTPRPPRPPPTLDAHLDAMEEVYTSVKSSRIKT